MHGTRRLRALALVASGLLLLAAVALLARLATSGSQAVSDRAWLEDAAETWSEAAADALTEAGFGVDRLDPSDPLLEARVIVITESINERVARRVIESLLYLDGRDGAAPITLYLATVGGLLDPAFAIVDAIASIHAPVDTIAIGGCFSAGTVVLAAGTGTRSATPNAIVSIHANSEAGDDPFSYERIARERMVRHFEAHAALPREWFPLVGDTSYYLTAEEALKRGLIDRIVEPEVRGRAGIERAP